MSSSCWEAPCRQNASVCESSDKSTSFPTPYHLISSRQKRLRPRLGCALRNAIMSLKKRNMSRLRWSRSQLSQVVWLSWLLGLLLPPCVFMNSSPAQNIGVPLDRNSRQQKFLICCLRSSITPAGTSVSPSHPQFHDRL